MAPTPPQRLPPIQLTLTFPTFSSLSASHATQYLPTITSLASRSSHLTIIIKTPSGFPFTSTGSDAEVGGSSTSGSRTKARANGKGKGRAGPTSEWETLQGLLGKLYGTASSVFVKEDRWEDVVDVILEGMRELNVCAGDGEERVALTVTEEKGEGEDEGEGEGEGDGRDYETIAMGGTFDHLHAGHKILLTMAAFITRGGGRLIVGVTGAVPLSICPSSFVMIGELSATDTNLLTKKKHAEHLESLEVRIQNVKSFLEMIKPSITGDVVAIQDVYGPTATDASVEAIVVSDETRSGGEAVNKKRSESNLSILDVWAIALISEDGEKGLDSGGLKEGEKLEVELKMGSTAIREWISKKEGGGGGDK